jgi:hypothetical protein
LSELFTETCKLLSVGRICTSGYHPQSSMVERLHRTLHDSISHYVDNSGVRWDEMIPYFAIAYNITPHTSIGYSPYYLMYGKAMRLPTREDLRPVVEAEDSVIPSVRGHLEVLKQRFMEAYDKVGKRMARSHARNKRLYDRTACYRSFQPGDLVYIRDTARKPRVAKFRKDWSPAHKLLCKLSDWAYKFVNMAGREFIVNVNRMKPCLNPESWQPLCPC